jgi:hypothetical protein
LKIEEIKEFESAVDQIECEKKVYALKNLRG